MFIAADTEVYCIIGNPVRHSLSPPLHTFMFEYYGINAIYVAFEVDDIKNAIEGVRALGIKGLNITVPFKEKAFELVDETDSDAAFLRAINTIKNVDGKLIGFNTDFLGFIDMFEEYVKFYSDSDRIVVIGAGGVAISVVYALYKLGVREVYVLNRSLSRAKKLSERFKGKLNVIVRPLDDKDTIEAADIIINCTSVGLEGESIPIELSWVKKPIIIDVIYFDTPLIKQARSMGLTAINGLDMFVGQAYHAFKIWTGIEFDIDTAKKLVEDLIS